MNQSTSNRSEAGGVKETTTYTVSHWGTYEVVKADIGNMPELRPFRRDPDPSPIGLHQLAQSLQDVRVRRPAVRKSWLEGGPGSRPDMRGRDPFVEVTWDEAVTLVASELNRVKTSFGNSSIFGGSYGWSSAGRFHHPQSQVHRFLNCLGGYVRHVDSYSLAAANVVLPYIVADMDEIMANHSSWNSLEGNTELFVAFGGIPTKNAQVNAGGVNIHSANLGVARLVEGGTKFVNIGPVSDNIAGAAAKAQWIQCRPNTDTAVMLALAYTLIERDLVDYDFIGRCCVGFERFRDYLVGSLDAQKKTPEWAAEISGVRAETIVSLAVEMARSRTMLNISWSLQRASHGEQPFTAFVSLAAMLGQIGKPGGGFGLGYGAINVVGSPHMRIKGPRLSQLDNPVKEFIPVARIADMLLNPGTTFTYKGATHRYPDIRLVYWSGGNPFHHHQDLNRLQHAWCKPDTIIVHEQYWTPTAKRADIVLPATISLERNDIASAAREGFLVAMKQAIQPTAEALDDFEIFSRISRRLGTEETFCEGLDVMSWLNRLYGECAEKNSAQGVELPSFDEFWQEGMVDLTPYDRPFTMLKDFAFAPEQYPLATPTGKIEIFSETIASYKLADCPGYPCWLEPEEWLGSPIAKQYPIHLLSDQPSRRLHSQLDASPYSTESKIHAREPVFINVTDAAARGISSGDVVEIFNGRGRCLAGAVVCDDIMPGVARLNTGAWFDPDPETGIERHGNPNVLTLDKPASSLSQGSIAQSCLVDVRRVVGEFPRVGAFDLPTFERRASEAVSSVKIL
ncbi:molybdopterin-dependent oxidoreductase [Agrobacterium sp. LAD9]|uniref:molybdopterin-dependent oxidoreductase n=1 Tax=Agrobacterium sp. LAD9 TaxID=2055153 RepID=UPI000D1F63CE|nr:molybdopterin-dependent oxidoreductase [Agrobacterium sp. LAD9]